MKTNFLKMTLVLFLGTLTLVGCRKGENDPLISLRTRDARISGEWKLVSYESTRKEVYSSGGITITENVTNTFDGTTWTETNSGGTDSYPYSLGLMIEKDGNYTFTENEDGTNTEFNSKWSWLDDGKKKTRILFDDYGVFNINQLKNDEMIFTEDNMETVVEDNGDTQSITNTMTAVYEKQ